MAIVVNDVVEEQARDDSNEYQCKLNGSDDEVEGTQQNRQVGIDISDRKSTGMVGENVVHVASIDLAGLQHVMVQFVAMDYVFEEAPYDVAEDGEVKVLQNIYEGVVVEEEAECHCHVGAEIEVRF